MLHLQMEVQLECCHSSKFPEGFSSVRLARGEAFVKSAITFSPLLVVADALLSHSFVAFIQGSAFSGRAVSPSYSVAEDSSAMIPLQSTLIAARVKYLYI